MVKRGTLKCGFVVGPSRASLHGLQYFASVLRRVVASVIISFFCKHLLLFLIKDKLYISICFVYGFFLYMDDYFFFSENTCMITLWE